MSRGEGRAIFGQISGKKRGDPSFFVKSEQLPEEERLRDGMGTQRVCKRMKRKEG